MISENENLKNQMEILDKRINELNSETKRQNSKEVLQREKESEKKIGVLVSENESLKNQMEILKTK